MKLIAHRGGSGLRVENTLAAFANAIELGAAGAELDVHLSRDGEVVVHHDDELNPGYCRDAQGHWISRGNSLPLATMTFDEMQSYDIGAPRPDTAYARKFPRIVPARGQHIPLLHDVIRLAKARSEQFILVVEIKSPPFEAARKPWVRLVDATLAIIDEEAFAARTILCSFDWGSLLYARQSNGALATWFTSPPASWLGDGPPPPADIPPDATELDLWRTSYATGDAPWYAGFDPRRFGNSHARAIAAAGGTGWFPYYRDFTRDAADELAGAGLAGAAWSVNLHDPGELARLARAGLENFVTDYPDSLIRYAP